MLYTNILRLYEYQPVAMDHHNKKSALHIMMQMIGIKDKF